MDVWEFLAKGWKSGNSLMSGNSLPSYKSNIEQHLQAMEAKTVIRSYTDEDIGAIVGLFVKLHRSDDPIKPITEEIWREFVKRSYNHGARDFLVAHLDGELVALVISTLIDGQPARRLFRILVEPSIRRRGLGSRLFQLVEKQGGPLGHAFEANCPVSWKSGCKFLEAKNFEIAYRTLYMQRSSDRISHVELADGYVMRPYEATPGDDAALIRLHEDGYRGDYDFTPLTLEDVEAIHGRPDHRLWILEHQSEIVGFCQAWADRRTSLIDSIVVDSRFRSQRLGYGLLTNVLLALTDENSETFELSVNANNMPAFRLYRKLGFETYDEERNYRRSCRSV